MNADEVCGGAGWSSVAATKFLPPRRRDDLVERPVLLERLRRFVADCRVSLICAPAGFGKSTLMLQLFAGFGDTGGPAPGDAVIKPVWLSLDEGDNDVNRLLVSLLFALRMLGLEWEVDPQILASQVLATGPQARAAIAVVVNALAGFAGGRVMLVLDDLHHVRSMEALDFLSGFVESLPPQVAVVMGSRTEPQMPLDRWRVRGELQTLEAADLQFNLGEARAMASRRGESALGAATVTAAMQRTEGWVAGLQLLLAPGSRRYGDAGGPLAERHLFDFFAQEVLHPLAPGLQDFLLRCSVLTELNPRLCRAVSQRRDAHRLLQLLYRSNLFIVALDERVPVLRFHDLFADFLRHELAMRDADLVPILHARAAAAEIRPLRAIQHWLSAQNWAEALRCMMGCMGPVFAEGGIAIVMNWLAQLPPDAVANDPDALTLQALTLLPGWNFAQAAGLLERAAESYRAQGRDEDHQRCCAMLPRMCISAGRFDTARRFMSEAAGLAPPLQLLHAAARAWLAAAETPERCAAALQEVIVQVEQTPTLSPPAVENLFIPHFFGMPGVMPSMLRLRDICRRQLEQGAVSWQLEGMAALAWPEIWRGERTSAEAALAYEARLGSRLEIVPMQGVNFRAEQVCLLAMQGRVDEAIHMQQALCETFSRLNPAFCATWQRVVRFTLAHVHYLAGDRAALRGIWPDLHAPRTTVEWPVVDTMRFQLQGQLALLEERLDDAEQALSEALALQPRGYLPNFVGDARPALAMVYLHKGDSLRARSVFLPLLEEMVRDDCLGAFLMEPRACREALLDLVADTLVARPDVRLLFDRLPAWQVDQKIFSGIVPVFPSLTRRERDVLDRLAAGDSNAQIAQHFDVSINTIKRHVGNVLAKLDCRTRGQAAARWRATQH